MGESRSGGRKAVIWDAEDLLENRIQAVIELPWIIPALTIIEMTDEDLDNLGAAYEQPDEYWKVLNRIVWRIQKGDK
jgi:hypothetical protein